MKNEMVKGAWSNFSSFILDEFRIIRGPTASRTIAELGKKVKVELFLNVLKLSYY